MIKPELSAPMKEPLLPQTGTGVDEGNKSIVDDKGEAVLEDKKALVTTSNDYWKMFLCLFKYPFLCATANAMAVVIANKLMLLGEKDQADSANVPAQSMNTAVNLSVFWAILLFMNGTLLLLFIHVVYPSFEKQLPEHTSTAAQAQANVPEKSDNDTLQHPPNNKDTSQEMSLLISVSRAIDRRIRKGRVSSPRKMVLWNLLLVLVSLMFVGASTSAFAAAIFWKLSSSNDWNATSNAELCFDDPSTRNMKHAARQAVPDDMKEWVWTDVDDTSLGSGSGDRHNFEEKAEFQLTDGTTFFSGTAKGDNNKTQEYQMDVLVGLYPNGTRVTYDDFIFPRYFIPLGKLDTKGRPEGFCCEFSIATTVNPRNVYTEFILSMDTYVPQFLCYSVKLGFKDFRSNHTALMEDQLKSLPPFRGWSIGYSSNYNFRAHYDDSTLWMKKTGKLQETSGYIPIKFLIIEKYDITLPNPSKTMVYVGMASDKQVFTSAAIACMTKTFPFIQGGFMTIWGLVSAVLGSIWLYRSYNVPSHSVPLTAAVACILDIKYSWMLMYALLVILMLPQSCTKFVFKRTDQEAIVFSMYTFLVTTMLCYGIYEAPFFVLFVSSFHLIIFTLALDHPALVLFGMAYLVVSVPLFISEFRRHVVMDFDLYSLDETMGGTFFGFGVMLAVAGCVLGKCRLYVVGTCCHWFGGSSRYKNKK